MFFYEGYNQLELEQFKMNRLPLPFWLSLKIFFFIQVSKREILFLLKVLDFYFMTVKNEKTQTGHGLNSDFLYIIVELKCWIILSW